MDVVAICVPSAAKIPLVIVQVMTCKLMCPGNRSVPR